MAEALWRLRSGRASLISAVGDDVDGRYLDSVAPGLLLDGCIIKGARTPSYAAVVDSRGECLLGLGDMELHNHITPDLVNKHIKVLEESPIIVMDGNIPQDTIDHVMNLCDQLGKPVFFEPTDRRKASKILQDKKIIDYASPNLLELRAMARFINPQISTDKKLSDIEEILKLSAIVSKFVRCLIVTLGSKGVIIIENTSALQGVKNEEVRAKLYPTNHVEKIENVSGAGDSFASGMIHGILCGLKESHCVSLGFKAATMTLKSKQTVSSNLNSINLVDQDNLDYKLIK